jgi:hypothetical protein
MKFSIQNQIDFLEFIHRDPTTPSGWGGLSSHVNFTRDEDPEADSEVEFL